MEGTYHLECHPLCSLGPDTPYGQQVTDLLVKGATLRACVADVAKVGGKINITTVGRHKKHIILAGDGGEDDPAKPATNIEILEAIISKGFQNRKNWRPTISDTMKAMDMWFRLTQGNPFDELLDTLASASSGHEDENPSAAGLADEVLEEDVG